MMWVDTPAGSCCATMSFSRPSSRIGRLKVAIQMSTRTRKTRSKAAPRLRSGSMDGLVIYSRPYDAPRSFHRRQRSITRATRQSRLTRYDALALFRGPFVSIPHYDIAAQLRNPGRVRSGQVVLPIAVYAFSVVTVFALFAYLPSTRQLLKLVLRHYSQHSLGRQRPKNAR